jgi:hypothetical protein
MNVYEKMSNAVDEFHKLEIKKTGKNKFAGYEYFELADFIKPILSVLKANKLLAIQTFTSEIATLRIVNIEAVDEFIEYTSPMSTANLKGCHEVQNLGAVQTYLRRYLLVAAFNIIEADALEATTGKTEETSKPTQQDMDRLVAIGVKKGFSYEQIEASCRKEYNKSLLKISTAEYVEILKKVSTLPDKL